MKYSLVYDSDCGPCTRFRRAVELLDARKRMRCVPLEEADRRGMLDSLSPLRRRRSFHLVSPSGVVWSGAQALAPLSALLPGGRPVSAAMLMCPPVASLASFVYTAFSRLHDSGSCGYTPGHAPTPALTGALPSSAAGEEPPGETVPCPGDGARPGRAGS